MISPETQLSKSALLDVLMQSPNAMAIHSGDNLIIELANNAMLKLWGKSSDVIGKAFVSALPELAGQPFVTLMKSVWDTGKPYHATDTEAHLNIDGVSTSIFFDFEFKPIKDDTGAVLYILNTALDVTERVIYKRLAKEKAEDQQQLNDKLTSANESLVTDNEAYRISNKTFEAANAELTGTNASQLRDNRQLVISNDDYITLNNKLNETIAELNRMAAERQQLTAQLTTANEELAVANEEMTSLNEELAVSNEEMSSLNEEYQATNENLVSLNMELEVLNKKHSDANDQLQLLNDRYLEVNEQLSNTNAELNNLNIERQTLNEELTTTNEELTSLNEELNLVSNERQALNEEYQATNEELQSLNAEHEVLNEELKATNDELHSLNDEYLLLNDKITIALETANLAKNAANLGTFDLDVVNDKLDWDSRCKELFGLNPEVDVTYSADFVNGLHPQDKKRVLKAIADAYNLDLTAGKYDVEYRTIGALDKRLRWVRAIGQVMFNSNKKPVRFIGTVIDITEQKEDDQRKNDFIGMVSHEMKTPLTSLNGFLQVMQLKAKKIDDTSFAGLLDRSVTQIKKMTTMINGFLNVSRFESGKINIDKQEFDMAHLVKDAEEESLAAITSHTIIFHPLEKTMVIADKDKIGQVINNFISNAIKYSPQGSTINVACVTENGFAKVTIKDEGMGIAKTDIDKLFDRYYRVEGSHMKSISGFGIGLYLSAEIIKRHRGQIGVDSKLGAGSTFWFTLPLA